MTIIKVRSTHYKIYQTKTQFVVPHVKDEVEKLQNNETVKGLSLSTILIEQNRAFLEERCNEGTMDDLVYLIRTVWDNYHVGKLITLVGQSTQAFQESPGANLQNLQGIDQPTKKTHGGDC